jgi:sugar O-acyltransferase (sialic acid O-acetyltransferase NeuD family)
MSRIGIIGAGSQARETAGYYLAEGHTIAFFWVDRRSGDGPVAADAPVITAEDDVSAWLDLPVIPAVGSPRVRRALVARWPGRLFTTFVSPASWIGPDVAIGPGTTVCPGAVVNRQARLGHHVLVNTGATVSHDCELGDYATLSPGCHVAGGVSIGEGAFLGVGVAVTNHVKIGVGAVVGAGAAVVGDVGDGQQVVGVPARVVKTRTEWF